MSSKNQKTGVSSRSGSKDTFDYIIVGAGSAGAVLANRLSKTFRVLLVEAGADYTKDNTPDIISDSHTIGALGNPLYEWGYHTVPGYAGHSIYAIRGKITGGSSAINAGVAIRALASDFSHWTEMGIEGWTFNDVLPYYKKMENTAFGTDQWHGRTGPFPIRQLTRKDITPMHNAFLEATLANGFNEITDFNSDTQYGAGPYPMNVVDGVRVNTAMAYLTKDVRDRNNLTILANTVTDKVLTKDGKVHGIKTGNGLQYHGTHVILSAGTYGSPAILLRSGIGPREDLEKLNIPVVSDLPVGKSLIDHPFFFNLYAANPEKIGVQKPAIGGMLWAKTTLAKDGELDYHISSTHLSDAKFSPTGAGFVLAVAMVRPESRGSIKLSSADPLQSPIIDLNLLAVEKDRKRMIEAVRVAQKIGKSSPLNNMIHSEINPDNPSINDAELEKLIVNTIDTYGHPVSSAPMGKPGDNFGVVNNIGEVFGVKGLQVVDASIFPDVPSIATNPTVIMAAEKIADHIVKS